MAFDRSFIEKNRASTERIRLLTATLTEEQMQTRVGEHWTVSIALAHLAFWDRRVMYVLDMTRKENKLFVPEIDVFVNDLSLPFWAAIPSQEAARLAIETSEATDAQLETYPEDLLEQIFKYNERWVVRALHRNTHLDEMDTALKG
jgi:hypothetical protein